MTDSSERKNRYGGGPHGLGDPNDTFLRNVELEVLIPQKMRDITRKEKCVPEVEAFCECSKSNGLSMVFFCRKENRVMQDCMERWYKNEDFKERCKEEYLAERSEFRRTGITKRKAKTLRELKVEAKIEAEARAMQNG